MSVTNNSLELLLKEIKDPHVQENFWRLKLYLESLAVGNTTIVQNNTGGGSTTTTTSAITKTMDCAVSVGIGDWVYQSPSANNFAIKAVDQNPPDPVIGVVTSKPVASQAVVLLLGITDALSIGRGKLFLGATGQASLTQPSPGYQQKLGVSFGDGFVFINPETTRIRLK